MAHYKKLIGEKVYLSPVSTDDFELFMQWVNDMEITQYVSMSQRIFSELLEKEAIEKMAKGENSFTIVDLATDKVIGNCSYLHVDNLHRRAEVGIMVGDKEYWSRGYGSDAMRLLLEFGFCVRNYNKISLGVLDFNERAINCYEKVGFKRQGVLREHIIRGNKRFDIIQMDILASEFFAEYRGDLLNYDG
jgi:RimJ/RimL family protein N-acetyltransferase